MWPMLLNMTRDECRRTLRRLELEAYSNMISVFRAQGALEDNRKKLLEELRAVLHISNDRHSAEARRVSNDELLATIAEQLAGPNTGFGWISEGRRRIPLMPRGIAQTMYTELADKAAEVAAAENKEIRKRLETEKLVAPKSNEEEMPDPESHTAEGTLHSNEVTDDMDLYPPIAMEDHTAKIWETELICRKRKIPEGGTIPDEATTPVKNMRNIPQNTNQKHLNLSQVYSRFSQPSASKSLGHSKHSYNQVSKVSTSKSSQPQSGRPAHRHRSHRTPAKTHGKATKKNQDMPMSPGKHQEYSGPPSTFQTSYSQPVVAGKTKPDYMDEMKPKAMSPGVTTDSPATVPHELADSAHPDDATPKQTPAKPCQLIVKKRSDIPDSKKIHVSEFKVLQKPPDDIKFVSNRQVVAAPSSTPKPLAASSKLVTTKVISSLPKSRSTNAPVIQSDKMIVVSKTSIENRLANSKIIITSSAISTPNKDSIHTSTNSIANKTSEAFTPKGIPATDLKVSAKTFVLNPKSGQKMVVLPAKASKDVQLPLFHFKGIPTAMKLVSVSSHPNTPTTKAPAISVVSKPAVVNAIPSSAKIIGVEPIKTANMADIVPVKGLVPPIPSTKISNPIVRPLSTKGNVIVVQKGATLGKTLTFTKNGNDVSKIIMGKNVNKLLQTSKSDQGDPTKSGNVIVLELNNEQTGRTTTMSEILGSRHSAPCPVKEKKILDQEITQDTPVLFDNQMTSEICNTSSLDSTTSLQEMERLEESSLGIIEKREKDKSEFLKDSDGGKDSSSVTDWDMELDTVSGKSKDDVDKLNSLHLDLGMSSDSENEFMVDGCKAEGHLPAERAHGEVPGEGGERYAPGALARTLLSQLQDDGSSSNDSHFAIKAKPKLEARLDKCESDALSKARAKLSEKVAEARSQQKRIDVYSTAISAEINLDSFSYLDEAMMAGDEERPDHLGRLLAEDSASVDSQTVSETLPLDKNEQ